MRLSEAKRAMVFRHLQDHTFDFVPGDIPVHSPLSIEEPIVQPSTPQERPRWEVHTRAILAPPQVLGAPCVGSEYGFGDDVPPDNGRRAVRRSRCFWTGILATYVWFPDPCLFRTQVLVVSFPTLDPPQDDEIELCTRKTWHQALRVVSRFLDRRATLKMTDPHTI